MLLCSLPLSGPLGAAESASESRWIADSVVSHLTRLAGPGRTRKLPPVPRGAPVWDPASYASVALGLFATSRTANPGPDLDVRSALLTPTTPVLLRENTRLSAAISGDRATAAAHESAALLVGALALGETASTVFSDVRPLLSRITAHLAAANAMRGAGGPTPDGEWARIVLTTLTGDQASAMRGISALSSRRDTPADRVWARALQLRNTGNWREFAAGSQGTLLERLQEASAIRARVGSGAFDAALPDLVHEDAIEWIRLVTASDFSVGAGRTLVDGAVEREWKEAGTVWDALHPGQPRPADLSDALNEGSRAGKPATRAARETALVLDWPAWAGALQRHLVAALRGQDRVWWMLGMPDERAESLADIKRRARQLSLYPILLATVAVDEADRAQASALARQLAQTSPETVTASGWRLAASIEADGAGASIPAATSWFVDAVPPGTAFDLPNRALRSNVPRVSTEQLQAWAAMQPYTRWTQWYYQWRLAGGEPGEAATRTAFGSLLTYDLSALRQLDDVLRTQGERRRNYEAMCRISFEGCRDLADFLVAEGLDTAAAAAYEQWIEATPDYVAAANGSAWLVRYYMSRVQFARAEALAREAGDAHSNRGMQVWGHFLDARGREAEAETVYQTINTRYQDPLPLGTFTVRKALRKSDPVLQQRGWNLMKKVFPNGGERLAWNTLKGAPTDGVRFSTFGRRAEARGLQFRDIIVGVDEWRLRTAAQYPILANLRHDENMTFTVWRDGAYQQIHAQVRQRWLGAELEDVEGEAGEQP